MISTSARTYFHRLKGDALIAPHPADDQPGVLNREQAIARVIAEQVVVEPDGPEQRQRSWPREDPARPVGLPIDPQHVSNVFADQRAEEAALRLRVVLGFQDVERTSSASASARRPVR